MQPQGSAALTGGSTVVPRRAAAAAQRTPCRCPHGVPRHRSLEQRASSQRVQALPSGVSGEAVLASLAASGLAEEAAFDAQMPGPAILVAVACAATPPILFWARIFLSAQRRQAAIDAEKAEEERKQREREVSEAAQCGLRPAKGFSDRGHRPTILSQVLRRKITGQDAPPSS